ncbi:MAG: UDP-N-acetylmuramoyl-tripeptide--D-alanyl-D-alanine ligase [bacterium]|nr:UDP-N-acetylmuramoyl-tripeptide--D-alanyl-D-alanine ligase [Candidatus Aquidulcis sp.]
MALSAAPGTVGGVLAQSGGDLAEIVGGTVLVDGGLPIRGAAVDSRLVQPGQMFLALPGERTHGLRHAIEALRAGASAIVVEGGDATTDLRQAVADLHEAVRGVGASLITVSHGRNALARAASEWRGRFTLEVIGVTGSVGKTTTKQLIAAALGGAASHCASTPGNANNEIGLPLSLLNLPDGTLRYVAEMGMYVEGDIRSLCELTHPKIGVVTAIDAVHAERAGDLDAIERAKGELVAALPADGWAVLAADDARVARLTARTPARCISAGFADTADVQIVDAIVDEASAHTKVTVKIRTEHVVIDLPLFGRQFAKAAALAIAVADLCGVSPAVAAERLSAVELPTGRATVHTMAGIRVIDDSYNAAPSSMAAALSTLAACSPKRFAALGAMGELGTYAGEAHLAVGRTAATCGIDLLIVFGAEADGIAEGARAGGMPVEKIMRLRGDDADIAAAVGLLGDMASPGDTILVKGSRFVALERLISGLAARWSEEAR